jgi:GNAT superfamily N-acetyltransferase
VGRRVAPAHIETRKIAAEETYPLRHAVLRPGRPFDASFWPGDRDPGTVHFGAFLDGEVVGIASLYHETSPDGEVANAWRLRGMATREDLRGQGYGAALLQACIDHARAAGSPLLWCNARETAVAFYKKHGLNTQGDRFEIADIGPHYVMTISIEQEQ